MLPLGTSLTALKTNAPLVLSVSLNVLLIAGWLASSKNPVTTCDSSPEGRVGLEAVVTDLHVEDPNGVTSRRLGGDGEDTHHQHDALLFLFNAIVVGAGVVHASTYFRSMQVTVVLFLLGMVYALLFEGLKWKDSTGVFGVSFEMWTNIDPHLLMFTLLPALLAGDAMTIDTSVARCVANQCLYLAGPGVLISAMVVAGFIMLFLDWSFLQSLCLSSILCATDPVAVVALLKELGASPVLTVQIQGESLLNDGTAIVLYMVAYDLVKGEEYDAADIVMFLVKKAMMAVALGTFIGYFFFTWIRLAGNKFDHKSAMIQIMLTLSCAYWSFIIAEGVFHMSGVLATVASSLVLAHHMWPHIVSPDSVHNVWHAVESLGNIIIFFLAGAMTGRSMIYVKPVNYLYLLVIYFVLTVVRGLLLFASRPLLTLLAKDKTPLTIADALVMTWGGLRGAVGLALAIAVRNGRAEDSNGEFRITVEDADLVVFFVSGIAFLTTAVNATTAPWLVRTLGITNLPHEQLRLLRRIYEQLLLASKDASHPAAVSNSLHKMMHTIKHHIEIQKQKEKRPSTDSMEGSASLKHAFGRGSKKGSVMPVEVFRSMGTMKGGNSNNAMKNFIENVQDLGFIEDAQDNHELIEKLHASEKRHSKLPEQALNLLGKLPPNLLGQVDGMVNLLRDSGVDVRMAKVVNRSFLNLVLTNYWKQIDKGHLRPGSPETNMLFTSVRVAMSRVRIDLVDFDFVHAHLTEVHDKLGFEDWLSAFSDDDEDEPEGTSSLRRSVTCETGDGSMPSPKGRSSLQARSSGCMYRFVHVRAFHIFIAVTIILNAIYVAIEEAARKKEDQSKAWLVLELVFTTIFTVEFFIKFFVMRCKYFKDSRNVFDFCLVVLGLMGITITVLKDSVSNGSSEARLLRITRVFRVLRFVRVFRLFHARLNLDKEITPEIGHHLHRILTLTSFVHAHMNAQMALVKYFGVNGEIDEPDEVEIARCILQSQVSVYRALHLAIREEQKMDKRIIKEIQWVHQKRMIVENLEGVVMGALAEGAISAREAESILHPLHHEISQCLEALHDLTDGIKGKDLLENLNFDEVPGVSSRTPSHHALEGPDLSSPAMDPVENAGDCTDEVLPMEDEETTSSPLEKRGRSPSVQCIQAEVMEVEDLGSISDLTGACEKGHGTQIS